MAKRRFDRNLSEIDEADIEEVRSLKNPAPAVQCVLRCVATIMIGRPLLQPGRLPRLATWDEAHRLIATAEFSKSTLVTFSATSLLPLPELVAEVRTRFGSDSAAVPAPGSRRRRSIDQAARLRPDGTPIGPLTLEDVKYGSRAAGCLFVWITDVLTAVERYAAEPQAVVAEPEEAADPKPEEAPAPAPAAAPAELDEAQLRLRKLALMCEKIEAVAAEEAGAAEAFDHSGEHRRAAMHEAETKEAARVEARAASELREGVLAVVQTHDVVIRQRLVFEAGKAIVDDANVAALICVADLMLVHPAMKVGVQAHEGPGVTLAVARARAAIAWLVEQGGVSVSRLRPTDYRSPHFDYRGDESTHYRGNPPDADGNPGTDGGGGGGSDADDGDAPAATEDGSEEDDGSEEEEEEEEEEVVVESEEEDEKEGDDGHGGDNDDDDDRAAAAPATTDASAAAASPALASAEAAAGSDDDEEGEWHLRFHCIAEIRINDRIEFDGGDGSVRDSARATLKAVGKLLAERPDIGRVTVEGHTCTDGPAEWNEGLSRRRAQAVRGFLSRECGVSADRLAADGQGSAKPRVASHEERWQNRRCEFLVM